MPDANEYTLTAGDVATQLGCGLTSVARWADSGKLPYLVTPGRWRKFRQLDVDAFKATLEPAQDAS